MKRDQLAVDWWAEERSVRERGLFRIVGIDEAGRGPLAGPVVAACVLLPFELELPGVRDSKQMTPAQRETAYNVICDHAVAIGISVVEPPEIDSLNILRATHEAMRRAAAQIIPTPELALIDGLPVHPFPILQRSIVKGDGKSASIAAASIIAKVTRDRIMMQLHSQYPNYGFDVHKGYPTPAHLATLSEFGPCLVHRRSFAPVARAISSSHGVEISGGQLLLELRTSNHRELGNFGENIVRSHLLNRGFDILGSQFHSTEGEIDIVAAKEGTLVFVEVKTLRGQNGSPAESVGKSKRHRILAAAQSWMDVNANSNTQVRFDVIEVRVDAKMNARIHHIQDAFRPGE